MFDLLEVEPETGTFEAEFFCFEVADFFCFGIAGFCLGIADFFYFEAAFLLF